MNANDLKKLREWRERDGNFVGIETTLALALYDLLSILGAGDFDISVVLGEENMEHIEELLEEQPIPLARDAGVLAYRSAKVLFEADPSEYGLIPTSIVLPDAVWDALEESEDGHFVDLGPLILDQNTRTVWMSKYVSTEAIETALALVNDQLAEAVAAMKEAGGGLLEISI